MSNSAGAKAMGQALGFKNHELPPEIEKRKTTPAHLRPRDRLVPMKILALGMPRTGTSSLREALYELGYADVHHMKSTAEGTLGEPEMFTRAMEYKYLGKGKPLEKEEWDQVFGYCEAVTDYPGSIFPEELLAAYPDAKVILTVRDSPEAWHKSVMESVWAAGQLSRSNQKGIVAAISRIFNPLTPPDIMRQVLFDVVWKGPEYFPKHGKELYLQQNELVKQLVPPENLLVFNAKEGWAPLCNFLEVPIPQSPYPRVNEGVFYKQWLRSREEAIKQESKTMYTWLFGAGIIGAASYYFAKSRGFR